MRRICAALALAACSFSPGKGPGDGGGVDVLDGPVDADHQPSPDGPFDPATDCPPSYVDTLPSSPSRYRIDQTASTAWPLLAQCTQDLAGRTHAFVPSSLQEVVDLDALLDARMTIDRFWIGGVQNITATVPSGGWIGFDGAPLLTSAWHTPELEPDDGGDQLENQGQQLLIIDRTLTYFHDATGPGPYGIVCECDGVPMHPTAQAYVDADPNNPN